MTFVGHLGGVPRGQWVTFVGHLGGGGSLGDNG